MASSVDAKLLKSTKFPPEFSQKVDMQKVNVEVMKKYRAQRPHHLAAYANHVHRWIAGKISDILGNEDDVIIELCFNLLEGSRYVRKPQLQCRYERNWLTGTIIARHQSTTDSAYRLPRQRYRKVLQGIVAIMPQCAKQPTGRA